MRHLKETSIDNKRMYCGLHGYSLVIGEDLHHWRDAGWDKVKLLASQLDSWWLMWVPMDAMFVDAANSLGALTDDGRAHCRSPGRQRRRLQAMASSLSLCFRGKSKWSRKFLERWWGFYREGFSGDEREALQLLLSGMHEEERARRVRIIELDSIFATAASAEPLPWHLPVVPPALLVSFDPSAVASSGAAALCGPRGPWALIGRCCAACVFSSTLKSIQAADARYHRRDLRRHTAVGRRRVGRRRRSDRDRCGRRGGCSPGYRGKWPSGRGGGRDSTSICRLRHCARR